MKAGEGVRTLDIDVGNVTLYQLSYARDTFHRIRVRKPVKVAADSA
jgi:hypothetical protein